MFFRPGLGVLIVDEYLRHFGEEHSVELSQSSEVASRSILVRLMKENLGSSLSWFNPSRSYSVYAPSTMNLNHSMTSGDNRRYVCCPLSGAERSRGVSLAWAQNSRARSPRIILIPRVVGFVFPILLPPPATDSLSCGCLPHPLLAAESAICLASTSTGQFRKWKLVGHCLMFFVSIKLECTFLNLGRRVDVTPLAVYPPPPSFVRALGFVLKDETVLLQKLHPGFLVLFGDLFEIQ
ncbi:hypothetical protein J6590_051157 [Homalodisca vitripennis]|nr:hypothetical protein J6590_051157 [Homalodisca vitripennis]